VDEPPVISPKMFFSTESWLPELEDCPPEEAFPELPLAPLEPLEPPFMSPSSGMMIWL